MRNIRLLIEKLKMLHVDIKFINNPAEFHKRLLCLTAAKYISIITLYLGEEKEDIELLKGLAKCENLAILSDSHKNHRTDPTELLKKFNIYDKVRTQDKGLWFSVLKELVFVQHCKMYVFDNIVIITGANCESRYFTTTLDNHYEIQSNALAIEILELMSVHDERFLLHSEYLRKQGVVKVLNQDNKYTLIKTYTQKEELSLLKYLIECSDGNTIFLSTGYLNLPDEYLNVLKEANVRIYCPSTKYTFCAGGLIGNFITSIYTFIYNRTKSILGDKVFVFYKEGVHFHKKGIWVFKGDFAIHMCGSSNFNSRSFQRDYELNYIFITNDVLNRNKFFDEVKQIDDETELLKDKKYSFLTGLFFKFLFLLFGTFM
ncbi:putative CDP-diacylglycerol--glycerol-3-phosphate 3-phosphatidyltransferase [Cucumispora dikerogammari]|nr:putative CDP-diacylglycerol--glycerol-3-phosphate 3-phosphatidyltransferase [Cucumispora dikerogammari]